MPPAPTQTAAPTLAEQTAALALAAPLPFVEPPAPEATLRSYIGVYGGGRSVSAVMVALGYSPTLAERVDQRVQVMPGSAVDRMAAYLGRPRDEILWACGGQELLAPAPGVGRLV